MSVEWCYLTILSSAALFSFCLQCFPASGSFPLSQFFASGGQSIGASASVLPVNSQDWFPLGLIGLISLLSKGLPRVFFSITVQNINSSGLSLLYGPTLTFVHDSWKTMASLIRTFGKVMSLLFNTLSRFAIAFLLRSKCLLISWVQSLSAVILKPKKTISVTISIFPHLFAMEWWNQMPCMILIFWMLSFF